MKMTEENRTDLPHDQVAQNNDGDSIRDLRNRGNQPLGTEESAAGFPPLGMDYNRVNEVPEEVYSEGVNPVGANPPELNQDDDNPIGANPGELNPEEPTNERNNRDGFREETAAEVAPDIRRYPAADRGFDDNNTDQQQTENLEAIQEEGAGGTVLGWTALVVSIISLFFLPVLTASIGVITGFFAYRTGARALGMWAIAIGLFSIVLGLFVAPFVR